MFQENSPERIVAILPPSSRNGKSGLGERALIGIIIAAIILALLIGITSYFSWRYWRRENDGLDLDENKPSKGDFPELRGLSTHPAELAISRPGELGVHQDMRHEADSKEVPGELPAC